MIVKSENAPERSLRTSSCAPVRGLLHGRGRSGRPTGLWMRVGLLSLTLLSGCVTTTDSPFTRKADAEKAEEAYVQLGLAYLQRDNLERARDAFTRAQEIDSKSAPAVAGMGLVYQKEGELELAERQFKRALSLQPTYTRGRTYYSALLFARQRYEEAYEQLQEAAKDTAFPDRAQVFMNMAVCAQRLGKPEAVVEAYERALMLQRDMPQALLGLATAKFEQGEVERARPLYERLVRQIRQDGQLQHSPQSLWLGIRLALAAGDKDQEASLALLLRNLYPESQEFRQYKAMSANDR